MFKSEDNSCSFWLAMITLRSNSVALISRSSLNFANNKSCLLLFVTFVYRKNLGQECFKKIFFPINLNCDANSNLIIKAFKQCFGQSGFSVQRCWILVIQSIWKHFLFWDPLLFLSFRWFQETLGRLPHHRGVLFKIWNPVLR